MLGIVLSGSCENINASTSSHAYKFRYVVVAMLICAASVLAATSAYAESVDLRYSDDYDGDDDVTTAENPVLLEYEGTQMSITDAALGSFPFFALTVNFDDDAATTDTDLRLFLSDDVFDPIFATGSELQILTETEFHTNFAISQRDLTISNLQVGIETVDIYVVRQDSVVEETSDLTAVDDDDDVSAVDMDAQEEDKDVVMDDDPKTSDDTDVSDNNVDNPSDLSDNPVGDLDAGSDDPSPPLTSESSSKCGPGTVLVDGVCVLGADSSSPTTEDPSSKCGPGTVLVDGVCVLGADSSSPTTEDPSSKCGPGTVLVDGVCVLDASDSQQSDTASDIVSSSNVPDVKINARDLITGAGAGFVIAGVVGVGLALMYRAQRTKKSS